MIDTSLTYSQIKAWLAVMSHCTATGAAFLGLRCAVLALRSFSTKASAALLTGTPARKPRPWPLAGLCTCMAPTSFAMVLSVQPKDVRITASDLG